MVQPGRTARGPAEAGATRSGWSRTLRGSADAGRHGFLPTANCTGRV